MQANRITVFRRASWRIPLNALRRAWASAAKARRRTTHEAQSASLAHDAAAAAVRHARDAAAAPARIIDKTADAGVGATRHHDLEAALGAVDFLAQLDDALRVTSVSDASIAFIGYHRDYLSMLTLHDLVPSDEADELNALIARARISGKLESATLHVVKSLTYPICVELRLLSTTALGTPGFAVAAFDVSHWRERENSLLHTLNHDELTGLDNSAALESAIAAAQAQAEHTRTQIWTTIAASTARSATTPATTCCARPHAASSTRRRTASAWRASPETNSRCCCRRARMPKPPKVWAAGC
jgi:diguanylate cyclase